MQYIRKELQRQRLAAAASNYLLNLPHQSNISLPITSTAVKWLVIFSIIESILNAIALSGMKFRTSMMPSSTISSSAITTASIVRHPLPFSTTSSSGSSLLSAAAATAATAVAAAAAAGTASAARPDASSEAASAASATAPASASAFACSSLSLAASFSRSKS